MKKSSKARPATIQQQIKNLRARVARLERPVRTKRQVRADEKFWTESDRRLRAIEARNKAMQEYYAAERERRYREDPKALQRAMDLERKQTAFLKSKGLEPYPSMIPPALRRKARAKHS
jgi:ribosomal protein S15P/S13E